MKRFRIFAVTLLLIVLGTTAAFADITPIPVVLVRSGALYIIIAVIVLIVALLLLRRSIRKHRMINGGNEAEEPENNDVH